MGPDHILIRGHLNKKKNSNFISDFFCVVVNMNQYPHFQLES